MLYVGIALGVLVLLIIITILISFLATRKKLVECPKCANIWHPKYGRMLFAVKTNRGSMIKCPNCGKQVIVSYLNKTEINDRLVDDDWNK